jgi:hypothetical protein
MITPATFENVGFHPTSITDIGLPQEWVTVGALGEVGSQGSCS